MIIIIIKKIFILRWKITRVSKVLFLKTISVCLVHSQFNCILWSNMYRCTVVPESIVQSLYYSQQQNVLVVQSPYCSQQHKCTGVQLYNSLWESWLVQSPHYSQQSKCTGVPLYSCRVLPALRVKLAWTEPALFSATQMYRCTIVQL